MKQLENSLSYTVEMEYQDNLWKTEEEDINTMMRLFQEITEEAESFGFEGYVNIYDAGDEAIAEVYESYNYYEFAKAEKLKCDFIGGYCKVLISHLEYLINK